MKKLFSLGIIVAASPLSLVIACGSDNPGHSDNSKDKNTDTNQYKPLAVGVRRIDLSDEDLWVWSSVVKTSGFTNIDWFRENVSTRINIAGDLFYPTVTQKEYDKILVMGNDLLGYKNLLIPNLKKDNYENVTYPQRQALDLVNYYYDHYKNSTIRDKIQKFDIFQGKKRIFKWL